MTSITFAYASIKKLNSAALPAVNWKVFSAASLFLICTLLVFYVFWVNALMNSTYVLNQFEKQLKATADESRNLEVALAETGFMETLREKTTQMNFEKVSGIKYIQIAENSVARAK